MVGPATYWLDQAYIPNSLTKLPCYGHKPAKGKLVGQKLPVTEL